MATGFLEAIAGRAPAFRPAARSADRGTIASSPVPVLASARVAACQFVEAGMVMRRLLHVDAADHSAKLDATVGYVVLDQKFAQGT